MRRGGRPNVRLFFWDCCNHPCGMQVSISTSAQDLLQDLASTKISPYLHSTSASERLTLMLAPSLGFGLGARPEHYEALLTQHRGCVSWLEALTENYLVPGGRPLRYLDRLREHYPIALHGVSLSIGGTDPLNLEYLDDLEALARRCEPVWVSDHLCWTGVNGTNLHDLLPLPYTEQTIEHVVNRIEQVQERLGRRILLENVSSYLTYAHSEMTEWEFVGEIAMRADCLLLLDINNVYVSAMNHSFDPQTYLRHIPAERVQQFHLAGHRKTGEFLVDTHDQPVCEAVWDLYAFALERFGLVSTMIERDSEIPDLSELLAELDCARRIARVARAA